MTQCGDLFRYVPRVTDLNLPVSKAIVEMLEERDRMLEDYLSSMECAGGETPEINLDVMRFYGFNSFTSGVLAEFEMVAATSTPGAAFADVNAGDDIIWLEAGTYLVTQALLIQGIGLANPGTGLWEVSGPGGSDRRDFATSMNTHAISDISRTLSVPASTIFPATLTQNSGGTLSAEVNIEITRLNHSQMS